jgi:hypothetical protein
MGWGRLRIAQPYHKEVVMEPMRPQWVSYHIEIPIEFDDLLKDLHDQNPNHTHERLLEAAAIYGINWLLEDRKGMRQLRQKLWKEDHPPQSELMRRVGIKFLTGRLDGPRKAARRRVWHRPVRKLDPRFDAGPW